MVRALSALCAVGLLAGCATKPGSATRAWTAADVVGLVVELQDSRDQERLEFLDDRTVRASFTVDSRKHQYRETFQWFLRSGRLLIHSDSEIYDELELLSRTPSHLSVRKRSGDTATYRIIH